MHRIPRLAAATVCVALTACGGGGGSSAPPPTPQVAISSANQTEVARSVVSGGLALALAQPLAAPERATALAARTQATALPPRALAGVAQRVLMQFASAQRDAARAQPLAVSTETEFCSEGGTVATTYDDRDNNGDASAGDVLTAVFTQCKEAGLVQIDGTVVLQVATVSVNNATDLDLSGSLAFSKVSARFGDTVATLAGSVAASVAMRSDSTRMTMTVGSDALRIGASSTGYDENVVYEPGMRVSVVDSYAGTWSTSFALDGSFTSDSLGGRITVATSQPVLQLETEDFPSSGQVLATGADHSQLRVTVVDATQVLLELDADGNGAFEASKLVPWSALAPI